MSKSAADLTLSEAELEQVRSDREGLEWLHELLVSEDVLETVQPGGAPSATPISGEAFDLIVEFEVTGEQTYTNLSSLIGAFLLNALLPSPIGLDTTAITSNALSISSRSLPAWTA